MFTKIDLMNEYLRETGKRAYNLNIMTKDYCIWLEEKLIDLKNKKNE